MLRGNPGKRKLHREPQPERGEQCPQAPEFLGPAAIEEWGRVAPELWRLGLLTVVDVGPLAAYCAAFSHWRLCEELIAREPDDGGLIMHTAEGKPKPHPLIKPAAAAAATMMRIAAEFGMSPTSRSRVTAQSPRSAGKFDGLVGD
jgi:P27 family predicted phage terminase small subunit